MVETAPAASGSGNSAYVHFYVPQYATVDATTLTTMQNAFGYYPSLISEGGTGLFPAIETPNNLTPAIVLEESTGSFALASQTYPQFFYDGTYHRYLYQFNSTTDPKQIYYMPLSSDYGAPYFVDVVTSVLYAVPSNSTTGVAVPIGFSMMGYGAMSFLLALNNVALINIASMSTKQQNSIKSIDTQASLTGSILLTAPQPS